MQSRPTACGLGLFSIVLRKFEPAHLFSHVFIVAIHVPEKSGVRPAFTGFLTCCLMARPRMLLSATVRHFLSGRRQEQVHRRQAGILGGWFRLPGARCRPKTEWAPSAHDHGPSRPAAWHHVLLGAGRREKTVGAAISHSPLGPGLSPPGPPSTHPGKLQAVGQCAAPETLGSRKALGWCRAGKGIRQHHPVVPHRFFR